MAMFMDKFMYVSQMAGGVKGQVKSCVSAAWGCGVDCA